MSKGPYEDLVLSYLDQWRDIPALTLAKKIYAENPEVFKDVEHARSRIRYYLGQHGEKDRGWTNNKKFFREARTTNPFDLPESFGETWAPVKIPEMYNKGLIISDLHLPYHDQRAINAMLNYTVGKREINFIIINGDGLDFYQLSRFMKDPRNRSLNDEIWSMVEFLNILQSLFEGVKIFYKLGNHCERLEKYLRVKAPELLDMSEFRLGEILKIRGVQNVDVIQNQIIYAGRLPIVHSHEFQNKSSSQVNPARGLFLKSMSSVLGAHSHVTSSHSETDINGKLMSTWSVGCLCSLHPEYARINRWNHGWAYIELEGQEFEIENMKCFDGKVYRA